MPDNKDYLLKTAKDNKKSQNYRILGLVFACMLIFFLLYRIESVKNTIDWFFGVLAPVFSGVALAYLLNPVMIFFENRFVKLFKNSKKSEKKKNKLIKSFSLTLTVLFGIILLASLLLMIIPEFLKSLQRLIEIIPSQLNKFLNWLESQKTSDNEFMKNIGEVLQSVIDYFNEWLETTLDSSISKVLSIATTSVISVVMFLINFFISIVVAVYALLSKKKFIGQAKKTLFALFSPERANDVLTTARHGHKVFGKYLSGKIITSTLIGIACFILMSIFRIPHAIIVSTIIGFTNIIPYFGPFIGGIPSALIVMLTEMDKGIIFIIIIVVLQQIEGNIIEPRIIGIKTGISEFWVTFSLLLFGGIFGFIGMIIAVPLFAVLYYIAGLIVNRRLEKKNLPISSDEYLSVESLSEEGFTYLPENDSDLEKSIKQRVREYVNKIKEKSRNKKK